MTEEKKESKAEKEKDSHLKNIVGEISSDKKPIVKPIIDTGSTFEVFNKREKDKKK